LVDYNVEVSPPSNLHGLQNSKLKWGVPPTTAQIPIFLSTGLANNQSMLFSVRICANSRASLPVERIRAVQRATTIKIGNNCPRHEPCTFPLPGGQSMFEIIDARWLAAEVKRFEVRAPRIAVKQQPGQFVIVRVHDHGERIPLTIAGSDKDAGTITLVVQGIGKTTQLMNSLEAGQYLLDVVGPLGNPSEVRLFGTVVVIGGGVGTAIAWPTAGALHSAGNRVLSILGARSKPLIILEDELRAVSDSLFITTDDGSYGQRGLVTEKLQELIQDEERIDLILAIGPIPMMRGVADVTRPHHIPTTVSLNSIMVDGTGMCGGCRVLVGDQAKFACVDGPEFDAHQVDFDVLTQRNAMYRAAERDALERFKRDPQQDLKRVDHQCRLVERHPEVKP
jgi:ferredoxin--NADP+ reductase